MEIIFATNNKHKLEEARQILGLDFILKTPADLGLLEEIPETSDTLQGNAIQKARYIFDRTGKNCFADDTGLEVDALGGAPGVYSARYAGEQHSSKDNMEKLLFEMKSFPAKGGNGGESPRSAHFRCVIALILDGETYTFEGRVEGEITLAPSGEGGFGYDPVFRPAGYDLCFSELTPEEKNSISHRGIAMRLLSDFLKSQR